MSEGDSTQRLASRLADLRQLGDRNRAQHPVSVLRNDLVASSTPLESQSEADVSARAEAIARRIFSPVLARAEQLADQIRSEDAAELEAQRERLQRARDSAERSSTLDSQ